MNSEYQTPIQTLLYVEVGRFWKITLISYANVALFWWRHTGSKYTWRHHASMAYDFNLKLHPVCAVNVLLNNEQRGTCIKGQICPPPPPPWSQKLKVAFQHFHPIGLLEEWSKCRIQAFVILFRCYGNKNGRQNRNLISMVTWCISWRRLLALIIFQRSSLK